MNQTPSCLIFSIMLNINHKNNLGKYTLVFVNIKIELNFLVELQNNMCNLAAELTQKQKLLFIRWFGVIFYLHFKNLFSKLKSVILFCQLPPNLNSGEGAFS